MPEPADIDVASLVMLASAATEAHVLELLRANGHPAVRSSHGYVIQHLIDDSPTISVLASRLGISQQGASKAVAELERLGYASRERGADGRQRRVQLTQHGHAVVADARRIRAELEAQLGERAGGLRGDLVALLDIVQGSAAVRDRAAPPPEGMRLG